MTGLLLFEKELRNFPCRFDPAEEARFFPKESPRRSGSPGRDVMDKTDLAPFLKGVKGVFWISSPLWCFLRFSHVFRPQDGAILPMGAGFRGCFGIELSVRFSNGPTFRPKVKKTASAPSSPAKTPISPSSPARPSTFVPGLQGNTPSSFLFHTSGNLKRAQFSEEPPPGYRGYKTRGRRRLGPE